MLVSTHALLNRRAFHIVGCIVIFAILFFHDLYFEFNDPSSLSPHTRVGQESRPWLILTISQATHLQRRNIIRDTWQNLYARTGYFDARFVISDPGPLWRPFIEQENATYGDLIMLEYKHEDHMWANTVKTMEAFKLLVSQGKAYPFVSKMDEDSWIDAKTFFEVWLAARLNNNMVEGTYIGRRLQHDYPFIYGSGQLYTLSWDMVLRIVELFASNYINDEHEDVLPARLLYEGGVPYNLTILPLRASFDYYDDQSQGDGTAWAPPDQNVDDFWYHGVAAGSVNPHQLKDDEVYIRVAECYDENGVMAPEIIDWGQYIQVEAGW